MIESIMEALNLVFQLDNFVWVMFGVGFGMLMGAIPGLSGSIAIVLLLPFTFYLEPIAGIAMLMGLSKGDGFGGSIAAILFNIPGTPHAYITTLDGYPLAKKGKAGKALDTALKASCTADVSSDLILIFLAAPVAAMALHIGPPEYTAIILFSLVLIALAASEDPMRGLIATGFGLLVSSVGLDPEEGTERLMFGVLELADGISLMPLAIGAMALSEIFRQTEKTAANVRNNQKPEACIAVNTGKKEDEYLTWAEYKKLFPTIMRSTGIGSAIGILPGIGTTVASYLSYITAKRRSPQPEKFGTGVLEGIAAAEAGNNAVNGPNLVPLVTLGIPGNLAAALILGGFMIKGLTPGPMFMDQQAPLLYALFAVLLISNAFTFIFGKIAIRFAHKFTAIPPHILYACILPLCSLGAYISHGQSFDLLVLFISCIVGYIFIKTKIPLPVFLVAYMLGSLFEHKLHQTLLLSDGDFTVFLTRPISAFFVALTAISVVYLLYKKRVHK